MFDFHSVRAATTPAVLAAVAGAVPDRTFIVADDGELTYGAAAALCAELAAWFASLGFQPGERVGILLPNGIRWCAALIGAHAAGLCVVPLNTWYRREELAAVARRAGLRAIVTQTEIFGFGTAAAVEGLDIPGYAGALCWHAGAPHPEKLEQPSGTVTDPVVALGDSPARESGDALIVFTSGSSAAPKAVRLSHRGMIRTGHAVGERQGVRADDKFWFASPLFFVFGCCNALPNALTHAATLCIQEKFEPSAALKFIERHRCTVYYAVAPVTRGLASCEDLPERDISSLRTGTANATAEDLRIAIEVLGVQQVCNAYGMTEGYGHSAMTACTDPADVRMNCQGTALPTQQLRVVDEGATPVVGAPGDIQIRGEITPGYLDDPQGARGAFGADGWFTTGDIGLIDADGRLHYLGRKSEVMKVKGVNISPLEVESLLVRHELIDEAFVFGMPTPDGDESIACVLVSSVPAQERERLAHGVVGWIRERAAAYKVPNTVRIIAAAELPLTPTGKVSKRLLAQQLQH